MTLKNEISLCIPENRRPEKQRENASRMDAVKRHREVAGGRESLNELYEMRDQMYHAQQEVASRCVPVAEIRNIQVYAEHLEECIERKRNDIRIAHVNVTKKQKVLSDKMLDEKCG